MERHTQTARFRLVNLSNVDQLERTQDACCCVFTVQTHVDLAHTNTHSSGLTFWQQAAAAALPFSPSLI